VINTRMNVTGVDKVKPQIW